MYVKIEILLCIYLVFFIINFGTVLAYLQRCGLTKFDNWVTNYIYALVASLPGFFGTISILMHCRFPKYGWTLKSNCNDVFHSITRGKETYKSIWN